MRKFDVAYNPPLPFISLTKKKDFMEMDVDELEAMIKDSCAKSNGDIAVCDSCRACPHGERLCELLGVKAKRKSDTSGIEKMRSLSVAEKKDVARKKYFDALESGDPVKYLMDVDGVPEKTARQRMYVYKHKYGKVAPEEVEKVEEKVEVGNDNVRSGRVFDALLEKKNLLMLEREEYEKKIGEINKMIEEIDNATEVVRRVLAS